jgi:hypothetical protein
MRGAISLAAHSLGEALRLSDIAGVLAQTAEAWVMTCPSVVPRS